MRFLTTFFALAILTSAPNVQAQGSTAGSYDSRFEEVSDNCKGPGMELDKAKIVVTMKGKRLQVKMAEVPTLRGRAGRRGKLRASGEGSGKSPGVKVRYGLNGRVSGSTLQAVFVAEYYKGEKPLCTQSWSVAGKRTKF